ncbi:hypothetical protein HZC32_01080 [Candidatus Woesearchaeota archaeon]|nr:hypothetical protein [Candidatus Woesearchaeota archaeon]
MALNDLIGNKFFRIAGTLAALTVPYVVGCEGDTTNVYEGDGSGLLEKACNSTCSDYECAKMYGFPASKECYDVCINQFSDCESGTLAELAHNCTYGEYEKRECYD